MQQQKKCGIGDSYLDEHVRGMDTSYQQLGTWCHICTRLPSSYEGVPLPSPKLSALFCCKPNHMCRLDCITSRWVLLAFKMRNRFLILGTTVGGLEPQILNCEYPVVVSVLVGLLLIFLLYSTEQAVIRILQFILLFNFLQQFLCGHIFIMISLQFSLKIIRKW